jgi:hypothetical protein
MQVILAQVCYRNDIRVCRIHAHNGRFNSGIVARPDERSVFTASTGVKYLDTIKLIFKSLISG